MKENQVMFENVLNVVCLTDESFTRYNSALFECGFWLALLRLTVGLASKMVEAQSLAVWRLVSILSVHVVWPHLCSDRHERREMQTGVWCFIRS